MAKALSYAEGDAIMICGKGHVSRSIFISFILFLVTLFSAGQVFSAALTEEERNNIAVYDKVTDGVVNVTSTAIQMDFFFNAFPTRGSGRALLSMPKAIF
jgi:hypothetical protein